MSKSAEKILATAETLFNQHSFVSVGVDLIRDQSGCSKTTLYTYYKNKQQLIVAVLQQRDQQFRTRLNDHIAERTGTAALDAIFQWHLDWFQTDHFKGCLFVRAVAESNQDDLEVMDIAQSHKRWLRQFILNKCQGLSHVEAISTMYFHMLEALISRFLVEGFDMQVAMQCKETLDLFINTLQQPKSTSE